MNAIAPRLRANVNYRITDARSLCIKNLIPPNQPQSKCIHQRIARIARLKLSLAAEIRNAKAIPIRSHATNHALKHRMILMNLSLCGAGALARGL